MLDPDPVSEALDASAVEWEYWQNDWPDHLIACTRANAGDAFPRPLTPLTCDLVMAYEDGAARHFYGEVLRAVRAEDAPDRYIYAPYGLIYFNADNLAALGDGLPGSSREGLYEQLFGLERSPDAAPARHGMRHVRRELSNAVRVLPRFVATTRTLPSRVERQKVRVLAARPSTPASGALERGDLAAWLRRLDEIQIDTWWPLIASATIASAFYDLTGKLLKRWADDERGDLLNRLHVDGGGNDSAEAGRAITALAHTAAAEWAVIGPAVEAGDLDKSVHLASPAFANAFTGFIERFGHRGPGELELNNPNWRTDPARLLDVIAARVRGGAAATSTDGDRVRREAEDQLRGRLRGWRRLVVNGVLRQSRRMMPVRENAKVPITVLWDELRRLLDRAGRLLTDAGELPDPTKIVYLCHRELHAVLDGAAGPGVDEIARRVAQRERCLTLDLPELIQLGPGFVRPLPESYLTERGLLPPRQIAADVTELSGLGVASGSVSATATVLEDAMDDFEPGNVLVARTVDPGWSAILSSAGAIVLDIGGPMSHGAVVARELGIPCVVNVKEGTRRIPDGSRVTVDGATGTVRMEQTP